MPSKPLFIGFCAINAHVIFATTDTFTQPLLTTFPHMRCTALPETGFHSFSLSFAFYANASRLYIFYFRHGFISVYVCILCIRVFIRYMQYIFMRCDAIARGRANSGFFFPVRGQLRFGRNKPASQPPEPLMRLRGRPISLSLNTGFGGALFRCRSIRASEAPYFAVAQYGLRRRPISLSLNTGFGGALFRCRSIRASEAPYFAVAQYGLLGRPISLSLNTGFGGASRLSSRNPITMACPQAGSEGVLSPAPGRNSRSRRAYCPRAIARPPPHGKAIGGETQKKHRHF